MVADELREAGLPVTTVPTGMGEMYPSPFLEIWLEDESLLEDERVKKQVEEAIAAHPLTESDAAAIDDLPFQDAPVPASAPSFKRPRFDLLGYAIAAFIVVVALLAARGFGLW
jgi:hypothetical protein